MAALIAAIVVVAVLVILLVRTVRIVPQARAAVVERLGRYVRTQGPGLAMLLPFVDRMRPLIDLREQVVSFPPQPVITSRQPDRGDRLGHLLPGHRSARGHL